MNLDPRSLKAVLRDGAKSLGQLRRDPDREWPPEKVLQLALTHPDQFSMTTVVEEDKHQHPAIELGSELAAAAKAFVATGRGGGKGGVTNVKLHKLCKIKTERSVQLAADFPDLISTRQKGLKTYFYWRPSLEKAKPEASAEPETASARTEPAQDAPEAETGVKTAEPASKPVLDDSRALSELEKRRDRLIELVKDGTRSSDWICQFGDDGFSSVSELVEIVNRWPELFQAQVVQLGSTPDSAFLQIGLRPPTLPEGERQSQPVESTVSLQPPLAELVPAEQLAELRFKPASPDMARSRNDPRYARGGIARTRKPLVEL